MLYLTNDYEKTKTAIFGQYTLLLFNKQFSKYAYCLKMEFNTCVVSVNIIRLFTSSKEFYKTRRKITKYKFNVI